MSQRGTTIWPAAGLAFATTAALAIVPRQVHTTTSAAALGFDAGLTHVLLVAFGVGCVTIYALLSRRSAVHVDPATTGMAPPSRGMVLAATCICALGIAALYFPPFLARYGTYGEDKYFLSVLQRVLVGQRPYIDFEFIYGPLLIHPVAAWMRTFGYSMTSYYSFLVLVEAATLAGVVIVLARLIPDRRVWLLAVLVLATLNFNDNLGLSWIALRRLLPVVVLVAYATRAGHRSGWLVVALLLGVQGVLSVEYALACAVTILGSAIVEAAVTRRPGVLTPAGASVLVGMLTSAGLALLMMGADTLGWLRATWQMIALRGGGEAGFPFTPSVNSFAVVLLIMLGCACLGIGLGRTLSGPDARKLAFLPGDRLLVASLAYAAIASKSGLARSDMYHLVPPVLGLVITVLVRFPRAHFSESPAFRRASLVATALMCVTYAPGLIGAGRIWGEGLVRGGRDIIAGRPTSGSDGVAARGPRLGNERTEGAPEWTALAAVLSDPVRATRPVVYYGAAWGLDRWIGVPKPIGIYPTDDYLVSDAVGESVRSYLETTDSALVVISDIDWNALNGVGPGPTYTSMFWLFGERSLLVRFLEYWSSSHYGIAVVDEQVRKAERWRRTVGQYLSSNYRSAVSTHGWHVLERRH